MIPLGTLAGSRPGGPTVLTSDSFNRTNRQLTGSTDAALGGTPLPWHTNSTSISNFAVISSQLGANSNTDKYAYAAVNVGVSSMVVSFKVSAYSGSAGFALHASGLNAQPGWGESYELYISQYGLDLSAGDGYDGTANTLTKGDLVELVSDYPSVSVRINGVTVMSVTDTSGSAPGTYAGISRVGSTSTSWRVDDFMVSEVTASVPSNPAPSSPDWFATLTTGTPESSSVTVTASALAVDDVMVTGYEYSVNSGTTWVAVTPTGNAFHITGLTPSTSYPAPLLRAKDADGNVSGILMAQAFSTPAAIVVEPDYIWTPDDLAPGTLLRDDPEWTADIQYKIATDDVGGTYLYHMMDGGLFGSSYPASWSALGVLTDVDVTAEVWGVATAQNRTIGPRVRAPFVGNYHSYQALIEGSTLHIYLQGPAQTLGNQRSALGSAALPVSPSHMDRWYIRLQAIGTTLKAKAWPKQAPEPGTWLITVEDATYASGYVGFTGHGRGSQSRAAWSLQVTDLAS